MEGSRKRRLTTLLFNKPYGVLSQFTPEAASRWGCLAEYIDVPGVYAAGRLDADSEGLLLLTDQGRLQQRLTDPRFGHWRSYWVQVEGQPEDAQLQQLRHGIEIQGRQTKPAQVRWLGRGDAGPPRTETSDSGSRHYSHQLAGAEPQGRPQSPGAPHDCCRWSTNPQVGEVSDRPDGRWGCA